MREHQIISGMPDAIAEVKASTKAGFVGSALQAAFALAEAKTGSADFDKDVERKFSLEAEDFGSLLAKFLHEGLRLGHENKESYEEVRLSLITDKKMTGEYIGHPVSGFAHSPRLAGSGKVELAKNDAGVWESRIAFTE